MVTVRQGVDFVFTNNTFVFVRGQPVLVNGLGVHSLMVTPRSVHFHHMPFARILHAVNVVIESKPTLHEISANTLRLFLLRSVAHPASIHLRSNGTRIAYFLPTGFILYETKFHFIVAEVHCVVLIVIAVIEVLQVVTILLRMSASTTSVSICPNKLSVSVMISLALLPHVGFT